MNQFKSGRDFLKSSWGKSSDLSPQAQGLPMPLMQKQVEQDTEIINLPDWSEQEVSCADFSEIILCRRSRRQFEIRPLTLKELSYLLFVTDGLIEVTNEGKSSRRTAPSGGARHPFETYLAINQVEGLRPGVYRYLFLTHQLVFCHSVVDQEEALTVAAHGQRFCGTAPVSFIWTVIPERGEWRYMARSHKLALLDIGHVCQNLYLACESIGFGTCAIAAYDQEKADQFVRVDGENEFVIYMAPVGPLALP